MKRLIFIILFLVWVPAIFAQLNIPSLNWTPFSDWINVKNSPYNAYGDGSHDDTTALQNALTNLMKAGKTVYIPVGTYNISSTLFIPGNANINGATLIGNGRDTILSWTGASGGTMVTDLGCPYSRFIGLTWEGNNLAAIGFNHASTNNFETEMQHQHEAFRDFTTYGIQIGASQIVASAEILYENCLFTNCEIAAVALLQYNDYDNTFNRCEFDNNGLGVYGLVGNFYIRECHFSGTTNMDIYLQSTAHGSSVRRCTSVNSKYFIYDNNPPATLVIQDCQVSNWTSINGCCRVQGPPVMIFDCVFTNGASIPFEGPNFSQLYILCNNNPVNVSSLISIYPASGGDLLSSIYTVPNGKLTGVVTNANQTFLQTVVVVPGKIFDAKVNYGATGNGTTDDTTAIQNTINAAATFGKGAIAYIPTGTYKISQTLSVVGTNYIVGGTGLDSILTWAGSSGLNFLIASNVQSVTLQNFNIGNDANYNYNDDIWITSTANIPDNLTLDGVYGYGKYQNSTAHGFFFDSLPAGSIILSKKLSGNIWITNCNQATLLFRTSYGGELTLRGPPSTNNIAGFLTRVSSDNNLSIQVFENQSVALTDYYDESSVQIATFLGTSNSSGAITLQEVKMGLNSDSDTLVLLSSNYNGRICYGPTQFNSTPATQIFQTTNSVSLQFIIDASFWSDATPEFEVDSGTTLTLIQDGSVTDSSNISTAAVAALSASLDDLRRLGQLDLTLGIPIPPPTTSLYIKY